MEKEIKLSDELTEEMLDEFTVDDETENYLYARSFWYYSEYYTDDEVRSYCEESGHDFDSVLRYKQQCKEERERSKKMGTF